MAQRRIYILYILATALMLLTGCADNTYLGDQDGAVKGANEAIAFDGGFKAVTRAGKVGADAADLLGNQFIVAGFKFANNTRQDVFLSYTVNWATNTAGTTTTNTSDWEYTGKDNYFGSAGQTIKYWDWSQDYYNFCAYSVGKGNTLIPKTESGQDNFGITGGDAPESNQIYATPINYERVTSWPYFLRGSKEDLLECYITDMTTVAKDDYGKPVELKFRSLAAKVRVAFYETIPGYSVKDVMFYNSTNPTPGDEPDVNTKPIATLFGTNAFASDGTFKIFFPTIGPSNIGNPDYNKAHIGRETDGTLVSEQNFGELNYTSRERREAEGNFYLGRTSASATFAGSTENDYYTKMIPFDPANNEDNQTLELRMDYTLVSTDGSGETIKVYGAHVCLPKVYTKWQPNCAYTYLFKISDNTPGWTHPNSTDPAGLYPLSFDAVTVSDDDTGQQTTITTVAAPSITTYQKGHEYNATNTYKVPVTDDDAIYVQVMDIDTKTLKTDLNGTGKSRFYRLSKADASEAEVIDALKSSSPTITMTEQSQIDNNITTIPGANGNITVNAGEAARLKPTAAGTYAYVYDTGMYYPAVLGTQPTGWPTDYYTDATCTTQASGTFSSSATYYHKINTNKVYGVKVIKVAN